MRGNALLKNEAKCICVCVRAHWFWLNEKTDWLCQMVTTDSSEVKNDDDIVWYVFAYRWHHACRVSNSPSYFSFLFSHAHSVSCWVHREISANSFQWWWSSNSNSQMPKEYNEMNWNVRQHSQQGILFCHSSSCCFWGIWYAAVYNSNAYSNNNNSNGVSIILCGHESSKVLSMEYGHIIESHVFAQ